jgi:tRNA(Arg) A34 adenosine deaminase TadA
MKPTVVYVIHSSAENDPHRAVYNDWAMACRAVEREFFEILFDENGVKDDPFAHAVVDAIELSEDKFHSEEVPNWNFSVWTMYSAKLDRTWTIVETPVL